MIETITSRGEWYCVLFFCSLFLGHPFLFVCRRIIYAKIKMQGKKQEIDGVSALRLQGRVIVVLRKSSSLTNIHLEKPYRGKGKRGLVDLGVTLIYFILSGTD
jgi:hypothetical protein